MTSAALDRLYAAVLTLCRTHADLAEFTVLPQAPELRPSVPEPHPAPDLFGQAVERVASETRPVCAGIGGAMSTLRWEQSYSATQVGEGYLGAYAYFNLLSPEGPFVSEELRVSVGLWGQDLSYPRHWHAPEEIYCVLAGGAEFFADGVEGGWRGPGETWHNPSNRPHGMTMSDGPLLALAIWKGDGLLDVSTLDTDP